MGFGQRRGRYPVLIITIETELVSELNQREHWAPKAKRKKAQRAAVRAAWLAAGSPVFRPPVMFKLTRVHTPRRKIRDFDNLVSSFKSVIDEMADIVGIDDRFVLFPESRVEAFKQRAGDRMACEIEVIEK